MDKVARFEEHRSRRWLMVFAVVVVSLTIVAAMLFIRTYTVISERHTLDVLEIFYEDREIISEFWQDTLAIAFEELPQKTIVLGGSILTLLGILWIVTRHRRQIVARRLQELAKRQKSSNNT